MTPPTRAVAARSGRGLEAWLRSPLRRRTLIAMGVVLFASGSTLLWAEAFQSAERTVEWRRLFTRRLLDWSLWGLALEPIIALSTRLAGWIRHGAPLLLVHAVLSVGVAQGLGELNSWLTGKLFDPPRWVTHRIRRGTEGEEGLGEGALRRPRSRFAAWSRLNRSRRPEIGILLYWMTVGLGWGVGAFLHQRQQERHASALELRAARLETELSRARLASLESQLHPHFLFNALHSVGGLVRDGQERAALSTLSALGDLLRSTLEHGGAQEVSLAEELALVERYLDIERIRFGERLRSSTHLESGLGRSRVPALLLLPLVENAVQHGIAPRPEGGRVEVRARPEGTSLVIEVTDDGPGFPPAILEAGAGSLGGLRGGGADRPHIGLHNTRARLAELYGEAGSLGLEEAPGGGARVRVKVPQQMGEAAGGARG